MTETIYRYYIVYQVSGFWGVRCYFAELIRPLETRETIEALAADIEDDTRVPSGSVTITNWKRIN